MEYSEYGPAEPLNTQSVLAWTNLKEYLFEIDSIKRGSRVFISVARSGYLSES